MSAFHAQNPTQTCVWHGQKRSPHHTKNKKEEGSPDFLLFSMVWGDLDVTRGVFKFWARKANILFLFCFGNKVHHIRVLYISNKIEQNSTE